MKQIVKHTVLTMTVATVITVGSVMPTFAQGVETLTQNNGGEMISSQIQSKDIRISEVRVASSVEPGHPFSVTFRIENLSSSKITGLSLKITNVEGKATLDPFMPVGTTNEIYVGTIGYQDVREVTMTLQSSPTTLDGIYNFNLSTMFSVGTQAEQEITKTFGVMVQNTANVSVTGIQSADGALTATLMNEGTTKIRQATAEVTIGDQTFEQSIGNIDSESEGYLSVPIPMVTTDTQAKVKVTYQDATGSKRVLEAQTQLLAPPANSTSLEPQEPQGFWDKLLSFFGFGD